MQRPLREAEIGSAHGGERPGEQPRLVAKPCRGVGAVVDLVREGVEIAAGTERAANALHDDVVAAGRIDASEQHRHRIAATVGGANQNRPRRIRRQRPVVVGEQLDAVAHRHSSITGNVVFTGVRRQAQQAANGATDEVLGVGHCIQATQEVGRPPRPPR